MKRLKIVLLFFVMAISLTFCAMKPELQAEFPEEIRAVYFQKWMEGADGTVGGTDFYLEFGKSLSKDIHLDKIYFRNQEAKLEAAAKNSFVAHFYSRNTISDFILDRDSLKEYGNKAPVIIKPKFSLRPDEAVLEYMQNNKTYFFKIINPKEKPAIKRPSGSHSK